MKRIAGILVLVVCATVLPQFATARTVRHEEAIATYEGTWQTFSNPVLSERNLLASAAAGTRATVNFTGTGIAWIGYRCQCGGIARIYVDGALHGTVDTYAASAQAQAEIYRVSGLANGAHVLIIEVTGERSGAANGAYVGVDAFDVTDAFDVSAPGTILLQESDDAVSYTGDWIEVDHPDVNGGSVMASSDVGAEATVRFNGTGIAWLSYLCSCATGYAQVYVDGAPITRVASGNMTNPRAQELYRVEGLVAGDHTLRIAVRSERAGDSPWVVVDGFLVTDANTGNDGDRVPPTIRVYQLDDGEHVRGTVGFNGIGYDNSALASMLFFIDGVAVGEETVQSNVGGVPWDTTEYSNGLHTLAIEATDSWGNTAMSSPVTVMVDNQYPSANITAPLHNARITGNTTFAVDTADNFGVARVRFFANGILIGEDTTAPFALTRDVSSVPDGKTFTLYADVFDEAGNGTRTGQVTVTVQH